jgi:hypothetical protein
MTTSPRRIGLGYLCAASLIVAGFPRPAMPQHEIVGSITGKVFDGDSRTPLPNVVVQAHAITSNRNLTSATTDERGAFFISRAPASLYTFTLVHDGIDYPVSQRVDARAGMRFLLDNCIRLDRKSRTASVVPGDCAAELIAQAQVVTIGPHRFLASLQSAGEPFSLFPPEEGPGEENATPETGAKSEDTNDPDTQEMDARSLDPDSAGNPDENATDLDQEAADPTATDGAESDLHGLQIDHDRLECLQHDQFPLIDSAVRPGPEVAVCRVYFRSDKYPDFYYVEATEVPETPEDFRAILPKPSPETERVIYYVEAVSDEYEIYQTEEADPPVVDDACERDPAGYYIGEDPNIVVGATTAGAAAVPPGFQALGITGFISAAGVTSAVTAVAAAGGAAAAAGGLSTALVVVVSGAAVATGGTIVNTVINNGSEAEASNP